MFPAINFKCCGVFLSRDQHYDCVSALVNDDCPLFLWKQGSWSDPPRGLTPDAAFMDGRPSRACLQLCSLHGISRIISLLPLRATGGKQTMNQWHTMYIDVDHTQVGGITSSIIIPGLLQLEPGPLYSIWAISWPHGYSCGRPSGCIHGPPYY
jgi:hypothetical protein